jgi:hypothetical protein
MNVMGEPASELLVHHDDSGPLQKHPLVESTEDRGHIEGSEPIDPESKPKETQGRSAARSAAE